MEKELASLIDTLRPILQRDGGDMALAGYDSETRAARICFRPANYHCPGANGAMQMLFEKKIRAVFPMIQTISFLAENSQA